MACMHLKFVSAFAAQLVLLACTLLPVCLAHAEPTDKKEVPVARPVSPSGQGLADRAVERIREEAKEARRTEVYNSRPRKLFVGQMTDDPDLRQYLESWRKKIEEVGSRNYPPEAKGKLYGNVLLYIEIKSDGRLEHVEIKRSSGYKVLDDAVKKIVRMAAPFDRFPEELERRADIVGIARTFVFAKTDKKEPE